MEQLQPILNSIPIRHNLISSLMFLGVVLGYFLSLVIFLRAKKNSPIILFGWTLLIQSIVCTDTYLCYTGIIKYVLHANDSTEPLVLLIAPTMYFFVYGLLERKKISLKTHWHHFLLPIAYAITQIDYYLSPLSVKLNAYMGAYFDHMEKADIPSDFDYGYLWIKDEFRWLILLSMVFYTLLSVRLFINRGTKKPSPKNIKVNKYIFSRNTILFLIFLLAILFLVYVNFEDDGGDHIIVIFLSAVTLTTTFFIISESRFFENSWIADKYETLTTNNIGFEEIETFIWDKTYFTSPNATLKDLSSKLGVSPNLVSKLINSKTGSNFNDYINQKRVELAQENLTSEDYTHLTVEAIGNMVGFRSKSAFYNAFKKHVGTSPSQFVKSQVSPEL